jgi:hypothetical protein
MSEISIASGIGFSKVVLPVTGALLGGYTGNPGALWLLLYGISQPYMALSLVMVERSMFDKLFAVYLYCTVCLLSYGVFVYDVNDRIFLCVYWFALWEFLIVLVTPSFIFLYLGRE